MLFDYSEIITMLGASLQVPQRQRKPEICHAAPSYEDSNANELGPKIQAGGGPKEERDHAHSPPRVLVVDDDPTVLLVAKHMLTKLGCEVTTEDDGPAAVELSREGSIDLIFMDYHLKTLDGPAATAEIRGLEGGSRHIPIIAITAAITEDDRHACLTAGMDDYITKPIILSDLKEMLGRWLPNSKESPA
jgi:CheY-like chemotaxis protein